MKNDVNEIEFSVVIPCLNEAETLEACIVKAKKAMSDGKIKGEVVVADNGSTDGSIEIAERNGAVVAHVKNKGYGNALTGGIMATKGKYIIMGDADDSYDFFDIPRFAAKIKEGYDLVQGCRLPSGGGIVSQGAMPWPHRWIGNPMFSFITRWWFGAKIHDVNCGYRAFRKDHFLSLDQRCTGMEFAVEMIIKSCLNNAKIAEVPITLHKDGRISRRPHLRTVRDGWRTLRFMLICSPRYLFVVPGLVLIFGGLAGYFLALPRLVLGGITFDANSLLFSSLAIICGYQSILTAVIANIFAITERLIPSTKRFDRFYRSINVERGSVLGLIVMAIGLTLLGIVLWQWYRVGFGELEYLKTIRLVIPGSTLVVLGFQTVVWSFVLGMINLHRR